MDRWKFYWATRKYHVIDNPTNEAKLDQFVEALHLGAGAGVLDIACGKAEMLCRIASRYSATCTGVEISPYMCDEARRKIVGRGMSALVTVINMRGQDFSAPEASFDMASCFGATWVWGGLRGTLAALVRLTKPGGLVAVGEPCWSKEPPPEYLAAEGFSRSSYSTHAGNVAVGEGMGLTPLLAIASSIDDWDRYEGLSWLAAADYVRDNPADPDVPEIAAGIEKARQAYLRWGRDCFNWAMYLFRKPH
jgi:ubiquinone/menaquinone biosynthesis C-methylase UbiE